MAIPATTPAMPIPTLAETPKAASGGGGGKLVLGLLLGLLLGAGGMYGLAAGGVVPVGTAAAAGGETKATAEAALAASEKASAACTNDALKRRGQAEHEEGTKALAKGDWAGARVHLHAARTLFEAGGSQ
jgi:hypothetical protein